MTANELADELVWIAKNRGDSISRQLADIVRQQQAEIEALKYEKSSGVYDIEPVAWMLADKEAKHIRSIMAVQHDFVPQGCVEIPLYTHPVKQLTDEEIKFCWNWETECQEWAIDFARAILRKAQ